MGLLAEQVLIDCPPSRLEELFGHRPATWITPLLRLAADEGESAGLTLLGHRPTEGPGRRCHRVELGAPARVDSTFRVSLLWWATDYRVLFGQLDAVVDVRPLGDQAVLGIEGSYIPPAGVPDGPARRAAESATRSLLGHLRSAVEQSADLPR